jgi:hypothetical protein
MVTVPDYVQRPNETRILMVTVPDYVHQKVQMEQRNEPTLAQGEGGMRGDDAGAGFRSGGTQGFQQQRNEQDPNGDGQRLCMPSGPRGTMKRIPARLSGNTRRDALYFAACLHAYRSRLIFPERFRVLPGVRGAAAPQRNNHLTLQGVGSTTK